VTKEPALPLSVEISPGNTPEIVRPLVEAAGNEPVLKDAVTKAIQRLGFEVFTYASFNRSADGLGPKFAVWKTTPLSWTERYIERDYAAIDPVARTALRSSTPECWNPDRFAHERTLGEFFDDGGYFGLRSGVCMCIPSPDVRSIHFFNVMSSAKLVGDVQAKSGMADLWALGAYGHRLLRDAGIWPDETQSQAGGLTRRARECLTLAARGATSKEIARKLSISMRTVNAHLEQAIVRLGAKNRQEAVAKALTSGIIEF
jgi:DNA-binding CsgD family transcriptional regulator